MLNFELRRDSAYSDTTVLEDTDGNVYFDLWEKPFEYVAAVGDLKHTVTEADAGRIDLISVRYYQRPELGWLILSVNNILHAINELTPGTVLLIPAWSSVQSFMAGV